MKNYFNCSSDGVHFLLQHGTCTPQVQRSKITSLLTAVHVVTNNLVSCLTSLSGGWGLAEKLPHSQSRVSAASATTCLACYGYVIIIMICHTNLVVNTPLVKLRYQQLDLFNSDILTSAHKGHVFQLCTSLPQLCLCDNNIIVCAFDSLWLGVTCLISLYYVYKASRSCPL